ncbi:MAG: AmmeMemoRadiSam system protein B [Parcubacteria group bacterium]
MPLTFTAITPHPPIIIPTIGGEELKNVAQTVAAMKKLGKDFRRVQPDTVIIISPHAPFSPNAFIINSSPQLHGNFQNFGDFKTQMEFNNNTDLAQKIFAAATTVNIPVEHSDNPELDHGTLVPLHYLARNYHDLKIVVLSLSDHTLRDHFHYGQIIKRVINTEPAQKIALIASGDLSHRLTPEAPAGYSPRGQEFDELLVKLLKEKNAPEILKLTPDLTEAAGECGLRSICVMLGVLTDNDYDIEILSYEGPFGVGYLVTKISNTL